MKTTPRKVSSRPGANLAEVCQLHRVGKYHVWIKGGVLYLPVAALNPLLVLTSGRPLEVVTIAGQRPLAFMRAAEVIAHSPYLAVVITHIAARFRCTL